MVDAEIENMMAVDGYLTSDVNGIPNFHKVMVLHQGTTRLCANLGETETLDTGILHLTETETEKNEIETENDHHP